VPIIKINDAADARLADYRGVADPELAAGKGIFIAEGRLVVRRLLGSDRFATRSVLVTESAMSAVSDALAKRPDVPVFLVRQDVMNTVAGFNIHRGCLAVGERPATTDWRSLVSSLPIPDPRSPIPIVVVLERVANPDNVGGVFRSAAAFGAGAVLLDPVTTDPLYRKAIRTSMGAVLQVPFAPAEPWPGAVIELRNRGFAVVAMTPSHDAPPLDEAIAALAGRPVAIVLGHEGDGLTAEATLACEFQARIPISSAIDSLNVATAAAIGLYELSSIRPHV
jgi:tRNA G18 (ribose-2'-O)-methylase SpoU